MKLSIIIPIYGVESYIEKCLLSCEHQDLDKKEYEIICINDGTKDKSADIARALADCFDNIMVYDQINQGLSMARNNGLRCAKGDYVWFVDSDDYIEENCLGRLTSKLVNNLDVLQLQYRYVYENSPSRIDFDDNIIEGIQPGYKVLLSGGLPAPAPFCIYRRQFLIDNNLQFTKGIYHEDSEIKPKITYLAKSVTSDNIVCYNYLQRGQGSIMSSYSFKRAKDIIYVNNKLNSFSEGVIRECKPIFYTYIGMNMNSLLKGYNNLDVQNKSEVRGLLKNNKHLFCCMTQSKNLKYIIEGCVFLINIRLGIFLHSHFM